MNSLRRELFERHRWPFVAILIVALVAVPVLLRGHATASADSHVPAAPKAAPPAPPIHDTRVRKPAEHNASRSPFVYVTKHHTAKAPAKAKTSTTPASTTPAATTPAATIPTVTSSSSATPGVTASPGVTTTPAVTTTPSATTTPAVGAIPGTQHAATGVPRIVVHTVTRTVTVSTPATKAPTATPQSWTYYTVNVRMGRPGHPFAHVDIPRFTPLPKASSPRAMFAGVSAGGRSVIFLLAAGVQARGPGLCKPDHARCSAIVLGVNRAEQLTFTDSAGQSRTLILKATHVKAHLTHAKSVEVAAIKRQSASGACELELGDPVKYAGTTNTATTTGTSESLTVNAGVSESCQRAKDLVPFPGVSSGS